MAANGALPLVIVLLFCYLVPSNAATCPTDSVAMDDGECKCVSPCPRHDCQPGLQAIRVQEAIPEIPGLCCPLYECHKQVTLSYEPDDKATQCFDGRGQPRDNGDTWHELDPCTSCQCEDGRKSCHATMCRSCERSLPRAPGECCPRCATTSCPNLAETCKLLDCGELGLAVDDNGCTTCKCRTPVEQNEVMEEDDDDEEDDEEDEDGLDEDDECPESQQSCNLSCQWGFLMDSRGCVFCQCRPRPDCPAIIDCDLECPQGFTMDELGCPTCRCLDSCLDERNVTHLEGARWRTDYCRSCSCEPGGRIFCNETICAVACGNPLPPPPGKCCPICPTPSVLEQWRGWSTLPIILIVSLTLLCILLMVHLVCGRFRGRLVPSEAEFMGFPHHQQYYKCVPIYETHVPVLQHAEKVVPL